jgi:bis(5'-nucleosidyl)-tetraphosphatase
MAAEAEPSGRERSAGFVVTTTEGGGRRYLLLRHRNDGHWAFPKGRIEDGESEVDAAVREIREETGIDDIEPIPSFRVESAYSFERNGRRIEKRVAYFMAEVRSTKVFLSSEHMESRWLSASDAARLLTYDESRRVLECAVQHLEREAER